MRYDAQMTNFIFNDGDSVTQIREEIASLAAKFIAEEGAEYGAAKRRAVKQLLGNQKLNGNILPDNAQIEQQVREYQAIFFADSQPARLLHLRQLAAALMQELNAFNPYIIGAVLNGTAGEHSDIYLQLYTDNSKDVAIYLLNLGVDYEVSEHQGKRGEALETLSFIHKNEGVHLLVHDIDDLRHTDKNERANLSNLLTLIENQQLGTM
ncbi:hypothetical protein GCM10011282_29970 [Undibacterium macrobrachii]|uniref:Uncharacterized protein n=2 Tax=Undibacterium macrobrachii TaxID=1119058 RepID=A0ABQ2XK79_9BURK|nr:hypothetical protein GCM10011282_29970 [Undibacterium macrobrachii]